MNNHGLDCNVFFVHALYWIVMSKYPQVLADSCLIWRYTQSSLCSTCAAIQLADKVSKLSGQGHFGRSVVMMI